MNIQKRKQDFILLIFNCEKYRFKAEKQKNGWLTQLPPNLIYYHVIGNPNLPVPFSFDKENTLYVKTEDDYIHLPKKVIHAYEAVSTTYDYKYIFKTDDDQQLRVSNFFSTLMFLLDSQHKIVDYGGFLVVLPIDQVSDYYKFHKELPKNLLLKKGTYCNGRFYLLSKKAIEYLLKSKQNIEKEYFEDYAIGHYLNKELKTNFLSLQTSIYFNDF